MMCASDAAGVLTVYGVSIKSPLTGTGGRRPNHDAIVLDTTSLKYYETRNFTDSTLISIYFSPYKWEYLF